MPPSPHPLPPLTLVLGGARSGKSHHAEGLITASGLEPVYLATAEARDDEMQARIATHRERRGPAWRTVEAPLALATALERESQADRAILVDCLTLWLSNLLGAGRDPEAAFATLVDTLGRLPGPVVLVSNEVGQGIIPMGALTRRFVDDAGRLHQAIATVADRVTFMVAGLPWTLKGEAAGGGKACTS